MTRVPSRFLPSNKSLGRVGFLGALILSVWSCQLVGGRRPADPSEPRAEGPSVPVPEGAFEGFIEIEGGRVNGTLTLTPTEGAEFECFFESPPDLVALGRGRIRDREIRLELTYEGACPGRMTLEGRWETGSGNLTGGVGASDCTGEARGTFLFQPS
ncbi:MAG: hypothetical protein ACWGSQ_12600 [Longimicrobiales bacterium]